MKRLSRAVRQRQMGGRPLPTVFQTWGYHKIHIRRSEVTMIAGQPNAGKSLLALWLAVAYVSRFGLRGIYLSADSAELGQAARALAMNTMNLSIDQAEELLKEEDPWAIAQMQKLNSLAWSFEDDLSYDNIHEEIEAFVELWGTTPDFIVVDNLTDVEGQSEDEWATQRRALKALVQLARSTDAAVIVLHHTSEDPRIKEAPCPPRHSILGKCDQKPALIVTVSDRGSKRPTAQVKNRFGKPDKSGCSAIWLSFNEETMHFSEV
jgi:predicted ATP-dependent serine protease